MDMIDFFLSEIEEAQNNFLDQAILDDKLHRFGKKEHAWYIGNNEVITIGSWKFGVKQTFNLKPKEEKERIQQKAFVGNSKQEQDDHRNSTREKANWFIEQGNNELSLYLHKKKIKDNFGAKTIESGSTLLVPIFDIKGLHSLQLIKKDASKLFLKNTQKKSSFYILNTNERNFIDKLKTSKYILLTEGFATAGSIQMAIPYQLVACAFDCGNIIHVVSSFLEINPKLTIILCGDRDFKSKAGEQAIIETNKKYPKNTIMILPKFRDGDNQLSDFNDLHCRYGLEKVRDQISIALFNYMILF